MRLRWGAVALVGAALVSGCGVQQAARPPLTIYAAASLTASFTELAGAFAEANPQVEVLPIVSDGSSTLATQVIEGAPADVFASADQETMAKVQHAGLIHGQPQVFATNILQIAVAPGNPLGIDSLADLADPQIAVVLCAPEVPCGVAAGELLSGVDGHVVPVSEEQNVTAVVTKVRLGEADAGLVYATDIRGADGELDGIAIPGAESAVNRYTIGVIESGHTDAAGLFVDWVQSSEGQSILARYGFGQP
ncbi:molybdate ABC transporter substrate-binding protein [Homoserinimonas sp. A520]